MIVSNQDGQWRLVTQNDHGALAAEILSLWRDDGLPEHPRRTELLHAVREHDNGWHEADSAPRRRQDGKPHDFVSMLLPWRQEIWRRGIHRHGQNRPYAALLIVEHALELHRRHVEHKAWQPVIGEWQAQREELLDSVGLSEEQLRADYQWLSWCDTLSLAVCADWQEPGKLKQQRYHASTQEKHLELSLEPFPFAGATTLQLACRAIEARPYGSDVELAVALASARWQRVPVRLVPMKS